MYSLPLYSVHYSVNVLYNSAHTQEIMTALAMNETLRELRIANQYNAVGAGDEMAMSKLVGNTHLTKLSMNWRNTGSRNTSDRFIMRNTDLGKLVGPVTPLYTMGLGKLTKCLQSLFYHQVTALV